MKKNLNNSIVVFRNLVIAYVEKIVKKVYLSDTNTSAGVMTPFKFNDNVYRVKFDCGYYQGKMFLLGNIKIEEKGGNGQYFTIATIKLSGIECDFDISSMVSHIITAMNEQYFDKRIELVNDVYAMVEADVEGIVADIKNNTNTNDVSKVKIEVQYINTMFSLLEKYKSLNICVEISYDTYMDIFMDVIKLNTDIVVVEKGLNYIYISCINDANVDDNLEVSYGENKYENPENNIDNLLPPLACNNMTIRDFFELYKNEDGNVEEVINHFINDFMHPISVEIFENLVKKTDDDGIFFITEDADGDLYVAGNEYFCMTYFNDDVPMSQVYSSLMDSMKKEITKIENKIEKEIEESKYKVLDAFACESNFDVDYSEWWDYVMGKTPDWIEDKYYEKFFEVLYDYFVEYAKDYDYEVEKIDGGISLKKSDYKKKSFENFREEAKDIIAIFDSASSTNIEYQECWDRMQDLVREIAESQ